MEGGLNQVKVQAIKRKKRGIKRLLELQSETHICNGMDIQLIELISPITWDYAILYGKYVIYEKLARAW